MALERKLEEHPNTFPEKDLIYLGFKKRDITKSSDGELEFLQYEFDIIALELKVLVTNYYWYVDGGIVRQKPYVEVGFENLNASWVRFTNIQGIRDLQYFLDLFTRDQ